MSEKSTWTARQVLQGAEAREPNVPTQPSTGSIGLRRQGHAREETLLRNASRGSIETSGRNVGTGNGICLPRREALS